MPNSSCQKPANSVHHSFERGLQNLPARSVKEPHFLRSYVSYTLFLNFTKIVGQYWFAFYFYKHMNWILAKFCGVELNINGSVLIPASGFRILKNENRRYWIFLSTNSSFIYLLLNSSFSRNELLKLKRIVIENYQLIKKSRDEYCINTAEKRYKKDQGKQ